MTAYLVHANGDIEDIEIGSYPLDSLQFALEADTVNKAPLTRHIGKLRLQTDDSDVTVENPAIFVDEDGGLKGLPTNTLMTYVMGYTIFGPAVVMPQSDAPW